MCEAQNGMTVVSAPATRSGPLFAVRCCNMVFYTITDGGGCAAGVVLPAHSGSVC